VEKSSPVSGEEFQIEGDLTLKQNIPLNPAVHNQEYFNNNYKTPLNFESLTSFDDLDLNSVMSSMFFRDVTTKFEPSSPGVWKSGEGGKTFTFKVRVNIPTQAILHKPGALYILKYAWIQYISFFIITAAVMAIFRGCIFKKGIVSSQRTLSIARKEL